MIIPAEHLQSDDIECMDGFMCTYTACTHDLSDTAWFAYIILSALCTCTVKYHYYIQLHAYEIQYSASFERPPLETDERWYLKELGVVSAWLVRENLVWDICVHLFPVRLVLQKRWSLQGWPLKSSTTVSMMCTIYLPGLIYPTRIYSTCNSLTHFRRKVHAYVVGHMRAFCM